MFSIYRSDTRLHKLISLMKLVSKHVYIISTYNMGWKVMLNLATMALPLFNLV